MGNEETIAELRKRKKAEEQKIVDEYMKEYPIPECNYYLKRSVKKLGYSIKDEDIQGEKYRVLYKDARRIRKWNEDIERDFKEYIWDAIIERVSKEEVFILEGNQNGLPEDEVRYENITAHLPR
jgi:hypothetical protein